MARIDDLRRANFKKYVDKYGAASIAKRLNLSGPSYIGQILTGRRPLSEKTARKYEQELGLAPLSLDATSDTELPFEGTSGFLMAATIRALGELLEESKVEVAPGKFAELAALAYEQAAKDGRVDHEHIRRLIKLVK
jgi:transcriptional regulator with XRE-family HTH domain